MELKRVVVTGLGAITPLGLDVETTWSNALKGVSGAGPITHFDATLFKTQFACEVKDFEPTNYLLDPEDRKELKEFRRNDLLKMPNNPLLRGYEKLFLLYWDSNPFVLKVP